MCGDEETNTRFAVGWWEEGTGTFVRVAQFDVSMYGFKCMVERLR